LSGIVTLEIMYIVMFWLYIYIFSVSFGDAYPSRYGFCIL